MLAKCSRSDRVARRELVALSAQSSREETFLQKKYTYAGSIVDTIFPACSIYYFTLKILQSSTQKYYNAEDTALLYYIEAHKKTEKVRSENRKVRLLLCLWHNKAHDDATNQARRPNNDADGHRGNKENSRDSHHRSHQKNNRYALAQGKTAFIAILADILAQKGLQQPCLQTRRTAIKTPRCQQHKWCCWQSWYKYSHRAKHNGNNAEYEVKWFQSFRRRWRWFQCFKVSGGTAAFQSCKIKGVVSPRL